MAEVGENRKVSSAIGRMTPQPPSVPVGKANPKVGKRFGLGEPRVDGIKDKDRLLTDQQIIVRVIPKAREATGWYDSKISRERERVLQYYNSQLPVRASIGSSTFISTDVYDAVEAAKAQTLETFAGGDDLAKFDPDREMNYEQCEAAMAWARYVIFQQNNGYQVFSDIIHDALMARIGAIKIWWEERHDEQELEFSGLQYQEVMALAAQEEVDDLEAEADDETGLFSGKYVSRKDRSKVRILPLPPEEFLVEPRAVTMEWDRDDCAGYVAHRTLTTKAELIREGYDPDKVMAIHYDDGRGLDLSPEVLARHSPTETLQALNNPIQPELEKIMLYESYARMVIFKSKGAKWYKVLHVDSVLLEWEEVDRPPFIIYCPLPVPHAVFGNNFAARVIPTQNARTVLIRTILDHAAMTVNPRWQVVNGGLMNPREMLDNRMGGLVNVRRPDTVSALQVPNLNPFVFQLLDLLETQMESTTGISSLSQGLNKDAISKQNSRGLVGDMVNLSTQRQKIIARNFAYNFFVPMLIEVVRLTLLHKKTQDEIEVAGQMITIDPTSWSERRTCTVSMHLGYGERDEQVAKMTQMYQGFAADPAIGPMFTPQDRYNLLMDISKTAGIYKRYLTPPNMVQPPPPSPEMQIAQMKQQTDNQNAQARMITAQTQAQKDQRLAVIDAQKAQQAQAELHLKILSADRENDRMDLESAHRVSIAEREMTLEEALAVQGTQKTNVMVNPKV